jgi:hypothetical protein
MTSSRRVTRQLAATTALLLSGCQTPEAIRHEGVTAGAGNAIAANTVMQMVDPWPAGVQDTDLATPADLEQYRRLPAAESGAITQTETSNTAP